MTMRATFSALLGLGLFETYGGGHFQATNQPGLDTRQLYECSVCHSVSRQRGEAYCIGPADGAHEPALTFIVEESESYRVDDLNPPRFLN
jgi:hypothetical protein